jgi:hypothetical protein
MHESKTYCIWNEKIKILLMMIDLYIKSLFEEIINDRVLVNFIACFVLIKALALKMVSLRSQCCFVFDSMLGYCEKYSDIFCGPSIKTIIIFNVFVLYIFLLILIGIICHLSCDYFILIFLYK